MFGTNSLKVIASLSKSINALRSILASGKKKEKDLTTLARKKSDYVK